MAQGCEGHALVYFGGEAVELGSAAAGGVFLGIEQADPQASGPGVAGLLFGPRPAGGGLVAGDEAGALSDGGGQAGDRRLGLGDDAVRRR
jgi:hypothetical protein